MSSKYHSIIDADIAQTVMKFTKKTSVALDAFGLFVTVTSRVSQFGAKVSEKDFTYLIFSVSCERYSSKSVSS